MGNSAWADVTTTSICNMTKSLGFGDDDDNAGTYTDEPNVRATTNGQLKLTSDATTDADNMQMSLANQTGFFEAYTSTTRWFFTEL